MYLQVVERNSRQKAQQASQAGKRRGLNLRNRCVCGGLVGSTWSFSLDTSLEARFPGRHTHRNTWMNQVGVVSEWQPVFQTGFYILSFFTYVYFSISGQWTHLSKIALNIFKEKRSQLLWHECGLHKKVKWSLIREHPLCNKQYLQSTNDKPSENHIAVKQNPGKRRFFTLSLLCFTLSLMHVSLSFLTEHRNSPRALDTPVPTNRGIRVVW